MNSIIDFVKLNRIAISICSAIVVIFPWSNFFQYCAYKISQYSNKYVSKFKPRKIIFIRHGQSEANVNHKIYDLKADWQVELTELGHEQAKKAGHKLKELLLPTDTIECYVSPYTRTRQTFNGVRQAINSQIIKVLEDPRLRELEFGSYTQDEISTIIRCS